MPRYWFTTHWPKFDGGRDTLDIYLTQEHREAAGGMSPGDRVFIYEFKSGPKLVGKDGMTVKRKAGMCGIICEAVIASELYRRPSNEAIEKYVGGRESNWAWKADTNKQRQCFISRDRVNELTNYAKGNYFFGFNAGRGIKEIEPEQYQSIVAASYNS